MTPDRHIADVQDGRGRSRPFQADALAMGQGGADEGRL